MELKEGMRLGRKEREMRVLLGARTEALLTSLDCDAGKVRTTRPEQWGEEGEEVKRRP